MSDPLHAMRQSTLNLLTIATAHKEHDATATMSGLMRFERQLSSAINSVREELRDGRRAEPIFDAMNAPLAIATRYGADDLVAVTQRSYRNFDRLVDLPDARLSAEATADALAWLAISTQTHIALRLLFQTCTMFGQAPNGKKIEIS